MKVQLLRADGDDPDPDAICCYGLPRDDTGRIIVRFVEDRPVGDVTTQSLSWACEVVGKEGKRVLTVVWDEASWHRADAVSGGVRGHNEHAREAGGVKLVIGE
jgi:hypothetical protein